MSKKPIVYRDKVLVHIDKKAQLAKRTMTQSGIYLSPQWTYMLYNLQYGEVLQAGEDAKKVLPEIEKGDIAIFHHVVEEKPNSLVSVLPNTDEIRVVYTDSFDMANQLFAVFKQDGRLIPAEHYVLLNKGGQILKKQTSSKLISLTDKNFDFEAYWQRQLAENKKEIEKLMMQLNGPGGRTKPQEIQERVHDLYKQNEDLTRKLTGPKYASFSVLAAPEKTKKEIGFKEGNKLAVRHDLLMPLFIMDTPMMLCYKKYIALVIEN